MLDDFSATFKKKKSRKQQKWPLLQNYYQLCAKKSTFNAESQWGFGHCP